MTKPLAALLRIKVPVIVILFLLQLIAQSVASFILTGPKSQDITSLNPQLQQSSSELLPDKLPRERFLILTTGDLIKLYKFSDLDANTLGTDYYLIRPIEIDTEQSNWLPNNSFSRWLQGRHLIKDKRRKSVIPESQYEHEEQDYGGHSGWLKPWITHVDYFFNSNFCDSSPDIVHCLVVVWLDKANNYVRYGSTPFPPATLTPPQAPSPTKRNKNNNVLWLHEFPPLEILRHITMNTSVSYRPHAHAMVVHKKTHRIHVALSDGSGKLANQILSGVLRPDGAKNFDSQQLNNETLFWLVREQRDENFQIDHEHEHELNDLSCLNVDEADGNLLFYYDNRRVFMVNVSTPASNETNHLRLAANVKPIFSLKPSSNQDIQKIDEKHAEHHGTSNSFGATIGFAMDEENRKLIWLGEMNTLFRSEYSGSNLEQVARLSMRAVIKSADTIQVHQGTIYISDSIKKSLLAYRLPVAVVDNAASGRRLTNTISTPQATVSSRPMEDAKVGSLRHRQQQVIAIEMPTIYGFRVFELDQDSRISRLEPALATRRNRFMSLGMVNSITSMPRSFDIDDLLVETTAHSPAYTSAFEPDARGHEPDIDLTPAIRETAMEEESNLANLNRLNTFVELLLVSILMITCFVVLNVLIRNHRHRHLKEIQVNLMKNCPI